VDTSEQIERKTPLKLGAGGCCRELRHLNNSPSPVDLGAFELGNLGADVGAPLDQQIVVCDLLLRPLPGVGAAGREFLQAFLDHGQLGVQLIELPSPIHRCLPKLKEAQREVGPSKRCDTLSSSLLGSWHECHPMSRPKRSRGRGNAGQKDATVPASLRGAAEGRICGGGPLRERPFRDLDSIAVLLAPGTKLKRRGIRTFGDSASCIFMRFALARVLLTRALMSGVSHWIDLLPSR